MSQKAVVKKRKSIYIVWIIPFVAMAIAGWMVFQYYNEKGSDIVVTFDQGDDFAVGKTPLMYNGIQLGQVSDVDINPYDITKVDVTITVKKTAVDGVARKGNIFWKVEPKLSLTEVTGLSTILGGVYIGVMPGANDAKKLHSLPFQTNFKASESKPVNIFDPGVLITLRAVKSDIKAGAPVTFRKINVGQVLEAKLTEIGVDYVVHIKRDYSHLVKENSKFWKISGVEVRASLAGLRVEMESLASVVAGGIAFNSPDDGKIVTGNHQEYHLFENYDQVVLDPDNITLVSRSGYNIDAKASHVYFKGMEAGDIISIDYDPNVDETTFKIRLKSSFRHLVNKDAYFWIVEPHIGLNKIKGLDAIAQGRYITFETMSASKELKKKFVLHQESPPMSGMHLRLVGKKGYNLKNGVNVIYRDIIIGSVRSLSLTEDGHHVSLDIIVADQYKSLINDTSNFYIQGAVEAEASLDGAYFNVGSISSMLNGGIVVETKDITAKRTSYAFELIESYRAFKEREYIQSGGKTFMLYTASLGSLKQGSPVTYKGISVGKVIGYELDKKSEKIKVKIYIEPDYADRVNSSTKFYNISGVEVKASLEGLKIRTDSIESLVSGGIAFKTPLKENSVDEMHLFKLYADEDQADENYVRITLQMDRGFNLEEGSPIVYKSMTIGRIKSMKLKGAAVNAIALIDQEYSSLFRKDTILWIEKLKVGLTGVENVSSLIRGSFLELLPGRSDELADHFFVSATPPAPTINKEGLRIVLSGSRLSSLKIGSPVFYRQIRIGSVEQFRLSDDATNVEMMLYIDKCYAYLVRRNSIFYNATALGMDVSLFGVKVSTETVNTMIKGGITLVTPDEPMGVAEEMRAFKLYDKPDESWLAWAPKLVNHEAMCE